MDLIQEGNLGLIRAVDLYNVDLGYKFSTYATPRILQKVLRAIAEKSRLARIPVYVSEQLDRVRKLQNKFEVENGREPTDDELANLMGEDFTAKKIHDLKNTITTTISLDTPIGDDKDQVVGDMIADTSTMDAASKLNYEDTNKELHDAISQLTDIEQYVINQRYGFNEDEKPYTLEEIGKQVGLTKERIRQIEKEATKKLKNILSKNGKGE